MKRIISYIAIIMQCLSANAWQTDNVLPSIADSLKKQANSIVLEYQANVNIHSPKEGEATFRKVITVLNDKGKRDANFVCFGDKFHTFDGFKGELLDASGKRIMTYKKSDLKSSSISDGLASDDKTYFHECSYEKYPYTIIYEWDMKYKYGFLSFPSFSPISGFNQSLVTAQYNLNVPTDMQIDYRTPPIVSKPTILKEEKSTTYQWKWEPTCALEHETLGPSLGKLIPRLYIKPLSFIYDTYAGKQSTWEELSAWQHSLQEGRDILEQEQVEQIQTMVEGLDNDDEKVKKLYEFLGEKMRYVSIQLGIGGLQPMTASETHRMGFGDCKALSYYLKAMLQAVGIASEYVVISTTNEKLYADYPNLQQMNHVILKVPLKSLTLWLECTNPFIPFGYIHEDIAGHDALIIRPQGGSLEHLPVQADSLHQQNNQINIRLTDTSQTLIEVERKSHLSQYEANSFMLRENPEERKDRIRRSVQLNRATIGEVEVTETPGPLPILTEKYTIQAMYGNKNGNRIFIPVNPFRQEPFHLSKKARKYDIHLSYGYQDNDTLHISLPNGYQVETKPKDFIQTYPFGYIKSKIEVTEKGIIITQNLLVKKGIYPANQINEFIAFGEAIKKAYNGKIVLKSSPHPTQNEVFQEVDVMPKFPSGTSELMKFIENNFQFPIKLAEGVPTGRVVVQVVIQEDGTITDAKVTEGIEPLIDKEALRVVSLMPKWEPGKIKGKAVACQYNIPVPILLK